ncbi:hypothetical protein HCR15_04140 [Wolbachia pipientis]|nr:hypothetical protein [Wolbachia pipientis]
MSSAINKQLVMNSLLMAINRRKPVKNLLLHSDQGSQYCARISISLSCKEYR